MNTRPFFQVVPGSVKLWAWITVIGAVATGFIAGLVAVAHDASLWTILLYSAAGLLCGIFSAAWLLGLGFIFSDARRRGMRPVLWVLVAILFPHLLGFLLYFVMRQPLASPCGRCGATIPSGQRFCSWCGAIQSPSGDQSPAFSQNQGPSR